MIPSRARAPRIVYIGLLVVVLLLGAAPASAKKQNKSSSRRYRLPVARRWMPDRKIKAPHHDYPAWDLAIPKRTAVRAVHTGRVRSVTRGGGCGRGVIVAGVDGYQYTYCHGSWVFAKKHRWVRAGQKIMLSGSTGHSTGPHLHLQIRGPRGQLLCPQPLLKRWARGKQVSPRATTARGCAYSPDRASYRSHRHGRRRVRSAPARSVRSAHRGGRGKHGRGHGHDRNRPGKQRAKGPARKPKHRRPGGDKGPKKDRRHERSAHARRQRKKERRIARRRRAWRARAERIRRVTAVRRAELALARRVRPLI